MEKRNIKLPDYIKKAIKRAETKASRIEDENQAMRTKEGDPVEIAEIRNILVDEKFAQQRRAEYMRSEFGLPPKYKTARRQIEERKPKMGD